MSIFQYSRWIPGLWNYIFFINNANSWKCSYNANPSNSLLLKKAKVFCRAKDCRTQGKQFCKIRCIILLVDNDIKEQLWIQSTRSLYFNLHLLYNNIDCCIVRGLLVALSHLSAEKKIQFAENSLVVCFFLTVFCMWEAKAGKSIKK